jgi:hypothetical protein
MPRVRPIPAIFVAIPTWLKQRIGEPTRGRGCRATKCIVCKTDVLAGFDEDVMAMPAIADPTPLSPLGEALALIEGRCSYELDRHGAGLALWLRTHWRIEAAPASDQVIVLTDHRCGAPPLPSVEIAPAAPVHKDSVYGPPPF